jgi:hypothetical protein
MCQYLQSSSNSIAALPQGYCIDEDADGDLSCPVSGIYLTMGGAVKVERVVQAGNCKGPNSTGVQKVCTAAAAAAAAAAASSSSSRISNVDVKYFGPNPFGWTNHVSPYCPSLESVSCADKNRCRCHPENAAAATALGASYVPCVTDTGGSVAGATCRCFRIVRDRAPGSYKYTDTFSFFCSDKAPGNDSCPTFSGPTAPRFRDNYDECRVEETHVPAFRKTSIQILRSGETTSRLPMVDIRLHQPGKTSADECEQSKADPTWMKVMGDGGQSSYQDVEMAFLATVGTATSSLPAGITAADFIKYHPEVPWSNGYELQARHWFPWQDDCAVDLGDFMEKTATVRDLIWVM